LTPRMRVRLAACFIMARKQAWAPSSRFALKSRTPGSHRPGSAGDCGQVGSVRRRAGSIPALSRIPVLPALLFHSRASPTSSPWILRSPSRGSRGPASHRVFRWPSALITRRLMSSARRIGCCRVRAHDKWAGNRTELEAPVKRGQRLPAVGHVQRDPVTDSDSGQASCDVLGLFPQLLIRDGRVVDGRCWRAVGGGQVFPRRHEVTGLAAGCLSRASRMSNLPRRLINSLPEARAPEPSGPAADVLLLSRCGRGSAMIISAPSCHHIGWPLEHR
jgi:hypothetical protein